MLTSSSLHKNLTEHLNSEIGLGTVTSLSTAKNWLKGTFLYVRLKDNPEHYHIEDKVPGRDLDERLENICRRGIALLAEYDLVHETSKLQSTEFGDAMARSYLQFDTMKTLLALPQQAKVSEILSTIAQAAEFHDIRFRAGEKSVYKDLNKNPSIRFPIPVNVDSTAHKVSLVIQSTLGAIDLPTEESKHQLENLSSKNTIFQHANRLIRCIIDCQLYLEDSVSARNALMLARSFGSHAWDDSSLHMMQLEKLGVVGTRKLVAGGIKSIEDLENVDSGRIEMILTRNPPYGTQLQEQATAFPRLRITMRSVGQPVIKKGEGVTVKVRAEIGFLNDKTPEKFNRRVVYVCLLADTSDGRLAHFARISAKKLSKGQEVLFTADLTSPGQTIRGFIMCDEFAGTQRTATMKPEVPAFMFQPPKVAEEANKQQVSNAKAPNTAKRRAAVSARRTDEDEFGDAGLDDAALVAAEYGGFANIDDFDDEGNEKTKSKKKTSGASRSAPSTTEKWQPRQLANGRWACNHRCQKDCKHPCCHEGLEHPRKPPKSKAAKKEDPGSDPKQTKLDANSMKTHKPTASDTSSTAPPVSTAPVRKKPESKEARDLDRVHNSVKSAMSNVPFLKNIPTFKAKSTPASTSQPKRQPGQGASSDYGLDSLDDEDLPDIDLGTTQAASRMSPPHNSINSNDDNDDNDDLLDGLWTYTREDGRIKPPAHSFGNEPSNNDDSYHFTDNDTPAFVPQQPPFNKQRSIFIIGDTSSSELNNTTTRQKRSTSLKREREEDGNASSFFPPSKKRKKRENIPEDFLDDLLLADDGAVPKSQDSFMQDVGAHAAQSAYPEEIKEESDHAEIKEEEVKPKDVSLKEWFESEFGTDIFTFTG